MEKSTPHHRLTDVQAASAAQGINTFTMTAQEGLARMGLTPAEAIAAVCTMQRGSFYKSMTTHANHRVWQDVYHVHTQYGLAYVKVTLWPDSRVVIQFKGK